MGKQGTFKEEVCCKSSSTCVLASGAYKMERNTSCKIAVNAEPLHAVEVEDITTGVQSCYLAREVAFLLKDAWVSRVTIRVWKTPVSGSLKPHKCSESSIFSFIC